MTPADVYEGSEEVAGLIRKMAAAHTMRSYRAAFDDCYQDGWEAALESARRYDPSIGPFDNYLKRWIRTHLTKKVNRRRVELDPIPDDETPYYQEDGVDHDAVADRILERLRMLHPRHLQVISMIHPIDGSHPLTVTEAARRIRMDASHLCRMLNTIRERATA